MLNWGIIGLGKMANQFASSIIDVDNSTLVCIASKSVDKLHKFSEKFKIKQENKFSNYEDLLQSNKIDAIYISTLNNTHIDLIMSAAKNKKKILCEKPICLNLNEAQQAYDFVKKYHTPFYEAIAYRSHPQTKCLLTLINSGEIGKIYKIESSFGYKVKRIKKDSRLFNKELGGGAILDVGCYPISFFNLFCSKNNQLKIINSKGNICNTGVDDTAEINISIGNDIKAYGKVSLNENLDNTCKVYGENGIINIPSPWLPSEKSYIEVIKVNSYYKKFTNTSKNIFSIQIKSVANLFSDKSNEFNQLVNIEESIQIMKILDTWKRNLL